MSLPYQRNYLPVVVVLALIAAVETRFASLDLPARRALEIFGVAIVGWTMTSLDDVFVALVAAVAMMLLVVGSPNGLFAALGQKTVWLLLAAFVFAEAFRASGLADLLLRTVAAKARTMRRLFHFLTALMLAGAFLIPSTTGRAATMLPLFTTIAARLANPRMRVAFALLFPTGILLGAFGSLVGVGAHIAAVEMLSTMTGRTVSFAFWTLLALPFAAATSFLATEIILRMFLVRDERDMPVPSFGAVRSERVIAAHPVLLVALAVVGGCMTAPWHGVDETLIALIGALLISAPRIGVVRFRDALRAVDWGLLLFLAATASLAQGLASSRAADQLLQSPLAALRDANWPPLVIAGTVAAFGIALHLVVHSRTARVAILVPPALLVASEADLNPLSVTLAAVAATGFCQTLMVSAKPVIMFGKVEGGTYSQRDLLRLSAVLVPLHLAFVILFVGFIWPLLGLGLSK